MPRRYADDYATCAIARGEIVELSTGSLNRPNTCTDLACTGSVGLIWGSETSGSIFQLDDDGRVQGAAIGRLWLRVGEDLETHLVRGGLAVVDSGYLMTKQLGDMTALQCQ